MTNQSKRGWRSKRAAPFQKTRPPSAWRRWLSLRSLVRAALVIGAIAVVGPAIFIGAKCYGAPPPGARQTTSRGVDGIDGYLRAESFTYLTLPEWFIVYSSDEYARFIAAQPPSAFPYLGSERQYWGYYASACAVTRREYAFETGYHVMLGVIGSSFTLENSVKALYENTIGRLTEWIATTDTPEDAFARRTAAEYGTFMHTVPWYRFPFASRLAALWTETPLRGPHLLRKIERRFALTLEYGSKAVYGGVIGLLSGAAYDAEDLRIHARLAAAPPEVFSDARVKRIASQKAGTAIVSLPRYEEFTRVTLALTGKGAQFLDIAGNDDILITVLARRGVSFDMPDTWVVAAAPVLTDPTSQRVAISVPVARLRDVAAFVARQQATIEHVYDY